jgi:hypothetical protein
MIQTADRPDARVNCTNVVKQNAVSDGRMIVDRRQRQRQYAGARRPDERTEPSGGTPGPVLTQTKEMTHGQGYRYLYHE